MEGEKSEVYSWLKSLSPHLKMERLSPQFEVRGFKSRRSLAFVKDDDLDTFFPSPDKLLLSERRILEAELEGFRQRGRSPTPLEPRKLNMVSDCQSQNSASVFPPSTAMNSGGTVPSYSNKSPESTLSPLDRRALERSDQLQVLEAQVESAKLYLEAKREEMEEFSSAAERRGKACSTCHKQGHNRAKCNNNPCTSVKICGMKDKHPELAENIRELQKDLKMLEQKYIKAKNDNDLFQASRQRARSSFFSIMRTRLRNQNQAKHVDRTVLDRDLLVLQKALNNKVPLDESIDWRLPHLIEEFKRGHVDPFRNTGQQFVPQPSPHN